MCWELICIRYFMNLGPQCKQESAKKEMGSVSLLQGKGATNPSTPGWQTPGDSLRAAFVLVNFGWRDFFMSYTPQEAM